MASPGVVAVAIESVNDLPLAGNVALAFLNKALDLLQIFLENHRFHGPPMRGRTRREETRQAGRGFETQST